MRLVLRLVLAVVFGPGALSPASGSDVGRVRGEVRDPAGKPASGAVVIAVRAQAPASLAVTATDEQGFLAIDDVPAGVWRVVVLAPGFRAATVENLTVGGPYRTVADVRLKRGVEPPPALHAPPGAGAVAAVAVRVVDDHNQPLGGVKVRLDPSGRRADPAAGETDRGGLARLTVSSPGPWRLSLSRAGWTRLVVPSVDWGSGEIDAVARLLPRGENARSPLEELFPPPRLLPPGDTKGDGAR